MNDIFGIFNKLAPQQKMLIGGIAIVTLILLGVLVSFLNEPNYSTVYTNLAQEDAAKVLEHLNSKKVLYKIEDGGSTIKVSGDVVYETRLELAAKGIPNSGILGYEIFDKSTMGMSEFMQKLNYKRALEGELSRTIVQQDGIEAARIHIVSPEKSIFKNEQNEATASVVLKISSGSLSKENISAIVNLVASSVEGLNKNNITLLDTKGRLLSQQSDDNDFGISTSKQYEIKQSIENYLVKKAQSTLDNILGYGNSIIQVNAELNFDQVERTMEDFDPERQVAISEQSIKTENMGATYSDTTAQVSQNTTTNYEISKTIQRVVEGTGNIKRLTVAAVINDEIKQVKNGKKVETVHEPRSDEQIQKLEQIVRNAVGINGVRGDEFSIVNIYFDNGMIDTNIDETASTTQSPFDNMDKLINLILIVSAIIASLILLLKLMKRLKTEKIMIGNVNPSGLAVAGMNSTPSLSDFASTALPSAEKRKLFPLGDLEDEISDEAMLKKNQNEKISNYVQKNPVDAAKLINSWLKEYES
ncbi:MAG: flagellar basal-body MS-ring/collar protein FliF [Melioribacteraceae bacterium]|jgi:flagellar M-ring protein FliF|nr:flagellar basal-body MS-ring/collar protein FliF [Melioribacteraceae bacterium]